MSRVPTLPRDDDIARVARWDFAPGAATGWHSHGWPSFVGAADEAVLRIHDARDDDVPLVAGRSYMRPPALRTIYNGSAHPIAFIEIEVSGRSPRPAFRKHNQRALVL